MKPHVHAVVGTKRSREVQMATFALKEPVGMALTLAERSRLHKWLEMQVAFMDEAGMCLVCGYDKTKSLPHLVPVENLARAHAIYPGVT